MSDSKLAHSAQQVHVRDFIAYVAELGASGGPRYVTLSAITPDAKRSGAPTATFEFVEDAEAWALDNNVDAGIYWQPAEPFGPVHRKMSIRDVAALGMLFADIDPPADASQAPADLAVWQAEAIAEAKRRMKAGGIQGHIVNSGGGIQVLAPLREPFEFDELAKGVITDAARADAAHWVKRFHKLFAGIGKIDGTHQINHLMRLPGTVNHPTETKRAAGRQPAMAEWVSTIGKDGYNELSALEAVLPQAEREAVRKGATGAYMRDGKSLCSLAQALEYPALTSWNGCGSDDNSAVFASLFETVLNAMLEAIGCTLRDVDAADGCRTVHEIIDGYLAEQASDAAVMAGAHLTRRGAHSIKKLWTTRAAEDPGRGPLPGKQKRERKKLAVEPATAPADNDNAPSWSTATHDRVKHELRELAESGLETEDPMTFEARLEQIAAKAAAHNLDISKNVKGKRISLVAAAYKAEKAAVVAKRREAAAGQGVEFPHVNSEGYPYVHSIPNVTAWAAHERVDVWHCEFTFEIMHGKQIVDQSALMMLRERMHHDNLLVSAAMADEGLYAYSKRDCRHPVKDYMERAAKRWDNVSRLDTWLIDYCHAPDNEHWRAFGRLLLIAIVRRVYHPGAKWDQVFTLVGAEGLGKSEFCRVLAIKEAWCLEGFQFTWDQKTMIEQTAGKLIAEYGEFAGGHKDMAAQKDAVTRRKDKARAAYARKSEERPRVFTPIANTNNYEFLISRDGNRRYVPCFITEHLDIDGLRAVIDQLYGEAAIAEQAHYDEHGCDVKMPEAHWAYFKERQETHRVKSVDEDRISKMMDGVSEGHISTVELARAMEISSRNRYAMNDVQIALERMGWVKIKARFGGDVHRQHYYVLGKNHKNMRLELQLSDDNSRQGQYEIVRIAV